MDEMQQQPQFGQPFQPPAPAQQPMPPHQTRRERQRHRNKMLLFGAGGALVAIVLLVGVYFLFLKGDSKQPAQQATNTQPSDSQQASTEQQSVVADATPQTYKSDKLSIELTHRKDWTLKEASDGALTITSPQISYAGSDGKSKTGVFTLRIGKGTTEAQQASIDKAIATRDSEVIAYTAPVESQRQYTNLSYIGAAKDMFGFFIVTSNTEFKAGAPLQYALQFSADSFLIAGGYGADTGNSLSFDPVPKASMDSDAMQEAIKIVESLKIY